MKRMTYFLLASLLAVTLLTAEQTESAQVEAMEITTNGQLVSIAQMELSTIADVTTAATELVASVGVEQDLTMMATVAQNETTSVIAEQNMTATMAIIDAIATKNAWSAPTAMTLASVQNNLYRLNMTTPARNSSQAFTTTTNNYGTVPARSSLQTTTRTRTSSTTPVRGQHAISMPTPR